jgi:Flp pilus assembly secretin CpaC
LTVLGQLEGRLSTPDHGAQPEVSPMRRTFAAAFSALVLTSAAPAAAGGLAVPLDGAVRLSLRGSAADVIVANPAVADVAIVDSRTVVVMGKSHGTTGLLVFDGARRILWDGSVTVTAPVGRITVYRGGEPRQYACLSRCERTDAPAGAAAAVPAPPAP